MDKKQLYNKIMEKVSIEIKKTLNEGITNKFDSRFIRKVNDTVFDLKRICDSPFAINDQSLSNKDREVIKAKLLNILDYISAL